MTMKNNGSMRWSIEPLKDFRAKCLRLRQFLFVLELADVEAGDHGAQLLRRLEDRDRTRGNLDGRTSSGIPRHARLAMANLERAEAAHFDVLLPLEGFLDRLEERVDHPSAIFLRDHRPSG